MPLSGWISTVTANGQPKNAVTVMFAFGAVLLCVILPSQVAFTSLVSAAGIPTIAAYGLIAILRLTMTPDHFQSSHFRLGKLAKPFYIVAILFNALVFSVQISPFTFPVSADTFNFVSIFRCFVVSGVSDSIIQACVIFGASTIFGIVSYFVTPEEKWLRREYILKGLQDGGRDHAD